MLLTKALSGVIRAAAKQVHPTVFLETVRGVGAQLGRQAASEWRLRHGAARRCDSRTCAQCLEAIGKQCGWRLRVAAESADRLHVTVLECQFTESHGSGSYLCELVAGLFAGVVAELLDYAKVCAGQCSETPPLDCVFMIYLQESKENLAIPGVVRPQIHKELGWLTDGPLEGALGQRLTPRETQVLRLIAHGLSDKQIAAALRLSVRTVENHSARIRQKLDIDSRTALVRFAFRTHLVEP
jgi:DNA-binding CsgD family transcriptional regulator/predicted hydrocarbon binding protein